MKLGPHLSLMSLVGRILQEVRSLQVQGIDVSHTRGLGCTLRVTWFRVVGGETYSPQ